MSEDITSLKNNRIDIRDVFVFEIYGISIWQFSI